MPEKTRRLKASMPPATGFRRIAALCCDAFTLHLASVMTSEDPEGPHRARVALRRLRSALTGFAPVLAPKARRARAGQARTLFRSLGRLRDADVLLAGCVDPQAINHLSAEADRTRAEVRAELIGLDAGSFGSHLMAGLDGTDWQRDDKSGRRWRRRKLDRLARRALRRAWAACLDHGADLPEMAEPLRHELRKDLKTLRYLSEFFAPFWPGPRYLVFVDRMRTLQDSLGTLNDLALARALIANLTPSGEEAAALDNAARSWRSLRRSRVWWS